MEKETKKRRLIYHIDVNSAYLSWSAVNLLKKGYKIDLRDVPSVVGGNEQIRHGIVLAASIPAKKLGIKTGDTLYSARKKCSNLVVIPPDYTLFKNCSNAMVKILSEYTPHIQRFSCDECFLDLKGMDYFYKDPIELAERIQNRIKDELGFTVNVGISSNKLLAKVASDFSKPNKIHTLYPNEIESKMWPLPVGELFGVGQKTLYKLNLLGIKTIGDLAKYDVNILKQKLKSYGVQIWNYANGIDNSEVIARSSDSIKGMGNSTTTHFYITKRDEAHMVITSLCESVSTRLRKQDKFCEVISVHYKTDSFFTRRKQRKLQNRTQCSFDIKKEAMRLFDELWENEAIRQIGVHVTGLSSGDEVQLSLFDKPEDEKKSNLDKVIDGIRDKYGKSSIGTAQFINAPVGQFSGGVGDDDYPMMNSLL